MEESSNVTTVLVVEPDSSARAALAAALNHGKFTVCAAANSTEAMRHFTLGDESIPPIAAVLLSIDPDSGMDALLLARDMLAHRGVPILFVSDPHKPQGLHGTRGVACYGHVIKGCAPEVLVAAVHTALDLFGRIKRFEVTLDASHDGLWEWDVPTGKAFFSPSYYGILGYEDREFSADYPTWQGKVHPDDLEQVEADLVASIASGKDFSIEYRMTTKGGHWLWVCSRGRVVERDTRGNALRMAGTFRDISRQKEAEIEARRNNGRMQMLVDILQHQSTSVQEFLDYALEQALRLTGSAIGYIYHYNEATRQFVLNTWSRGVMAECSVVNSSSTYDLEKTGIWGEVVRQRKPLVVNDFQSPNPLRKGYPPGHVQLKNFMSVPVFNGENIVGVVGLGNRDSDYTVADVLQVTLLMEAVWKMTDRIKADMRIKELLAEKELILKEVHHRIKNNLGSVVGLLQLQIESEIGATATAALEATVGRVESMLLLYNKLYESQDFKTLSVRDYLSSLSDAVVSNYGYDGTVVLEKDVDDFDMNVNRLQSLGIILNELLTNSMKYAFRGRSGGTVWVSLKREGQAVLFRYRDDGPGWNPVPLPGAAGGFGLTLLDVLARQLGAGHVASLDSGGWYELRFTP